MTKQKTSGVKIFGLLVTLMVAAVVIVGIYEAGSPAQQRARTLDQSRVDNLSQITGAIEAYYAYTFELPKSLDALAADSRTQYAINSLKDPETGVTYEYHVIDAANYKLCATFAFPSDNSQNGPIGYAKPVMPAPAAGASMTWYVHAAGPLCQTENVTTHASFQYCGIGAGAPGCVGGQSCVQLPGRNSGICVPAGKECVAAGCSDATCSLDKSNPPVVTCEQPTVTAPTPAPGMMPIKGAQDCVLMQDKKLNKMDCFGCSNGVCTKAPAGYEPYGRPSGTMGIPYACTADETGCHLVQ